MHMGELVDTATSNITVRGLTPPQRLDMEKFGERVIRFGVNFAVVEADGRIAVLQSGGAFDSDAASLQEADETVRERAADAQSRTEEIPVWQFADGHYLVAVPLTPPAVAAGFRDPVGTAIVDLGQAPVAGGPAGGGPEHFAEMLRLLAQNFRTATRTDEQIETVGIELARVYEELVLLHKISTNMRLTESDSNFLQLACDSLTDIVLVEGIAILLERQVDGERRLVVTAGSGLIDIDERMAAMLYSRLNEEVAQGREALLDSEVDSPFRYEWPQSVRNLIAVPLYAQEKRKSGPRRKGSPVPIIGLMVAVNRIDKPDFDSTDVKLFTSVTSGCAVFIENGRLFGDLKELFVGSLRALTNSIDAKDQYTRGHSERVALIARWLAERVAERQPLDENEIQKIYLAGLLHDIGKIGIDESVLRKNGKLTSEERECIQKHPSIGASILAGIKQMQDIVPGVLCHHERMDGRGYPAGLTTDQIPLGGKIVQLADTFDAMTSKRVYRDAMSLEHALEEIRKGLGTQFDETVGTIFLESDISHLWDLLQAGGVQGYSAGHFADYGTEAVGTLLQ